MKGKIPVFVLSFVFATSLGSAVRLNAAEVQLFTGFDYTMGAFLSQAEATILGIPFYHESGYAFFMPGYMWGFRRFEENSSFGSFFCAGANFATNAYADISLRAPGIREDYEEWYKIGKDGFSATFWGLAFGFSRRKALPNSWRYNTDLGTTLSFAGITFFDTGSDFHKITTTAMGFHAGFSFQKFFRNDLFLELGANTQINWAALHLGEFKDEELGNKAVVYRSGVLVDLMAFSASILIGYRFDNSHWRSRRQIFEFN